MQIKSRMRWTIYMNCRFWRAYQKAAEAAGYDNMLRYILDYVLGRIIGAPAPQVERRAAA